MGRSLKTGLDYFPLDVIVDDNLELIEAEHGLEGFAIVLKLWQKIYANGYYIEWNNDNALLFGRKINSEVTLINSVINSCFLRKIFDKALFEQYNVLTSSGIQKRFLTVCKLLKRSKVSMIEQFILVNSEFTDIITEKITINSRNSTQKKRKEKKGKEKELLWRKNFKNYKEELDKNYKEILEDEEFVSQQEKFYPGIDIKLSIEKAYVNYWSKEAGWKKKKVSRSENIDWKATFTNAIGINKVYKKNSGFATGQKTIRSHGKQRNY